MKRNLSYLVAISLGLLLFVPLSYSLADSPFATGNCVQMTHPYDCSDFLTIDEQLTADYNAVRNTANHVTPTYTTLGWLKDYDGDNGTHYYSQYQNAPVDLVSILANNQINSSAHGVTYLNYLSSAIYEESFVDKAFGDLEPQYPIDILGDLFTEGVKNMYGDMISSGATDILSLISTLPVDTGSAVIDFYSQLKGDANLYQKIQEETYNDTFAKYFIARDLDGSPKSDALQAWKDLVGAGAFSDLSPAAQSATQAYYDRLYNTYAQYWINGGKGNGLSPQFRQQTARRLAQIIVAALQANASGSETQTSAMPQSPTPTSNQASGFFGSIWGFFQSIGQFIGNIGQTALRIFPSKVTQQNKTATDIAGGLPASGGTSVQPQPQHQSNQPSEPSKKVSPTPSPVSAPAPTPAPTPASANQHLTAHVVDQSGNPVSGANFQLVDGNGKSYLSPSYIPAWGAQSNQYGHMDDANTTDHVPDGSYTLYVEKNGYDKYQSNVQISTDHKDLGKITMRKWSTVSAIIEDSSGKPIQGVNFWLVDGQGNRYGEYAYGVTGTMNITNETYDNTTGRLQIGPVPDGQYTLHVASNVQYYAAPSYVPIGSSPPPLPTPPSIDKAVQVSGADIFLGKIMLSN